MEGYKSFAITICGAEHTKVNKICQDASMHYADDSFEIAIVADGHGSEDYFRSHIGSQVATEVAFEVLKQVAIDISTLSGDELDSFKNDYEQQKALMEDAKKKIVELWREKVKNNRDDNPFTEEEMEKASEKYVLRYTNQGIFEWAYGTTIIAAVVTPNCWFALQLGDGNCIEYYNDNGFVESMPKDPCCEGEASSSLCQTDALQHFRHYLSFEYPQFVFVHTDGIDDSLLDDSTRNEVYLTIGASFVKGYDAAVENIEKNVLAYIAENWKRDDTTMAGIVCLDGLEEQAQVIYKRRLDVKKASEYKQACKRKDELYKICGSLQTTIESVKAKQRELEEEYKKITSRGKDLLAIAQKNNELIKQNLQILEFRQKELEKCNQIIADYAEDGVTNVEASANSEEPLQEQVNIDDHIQPNCDEASSETIDGDSDSTELDEVGSDLTETTTDEEVKDKETEPKEKKPFWKRKID